MSDPDEPEGQPPPPNPVEEALARARAALETPANATEEVETTDPHEAPLADPEGAPEPVYPKEPETAPRRSAADVARAMEDAPPELAVFAGSAPVPPPPSPAPAAAAAPAELPHVPPLVLGDTLSPVDLPEPAVPLPDPLRWTTTVIAVATLFLALFNPQTIRSWAYQLRPSPASAKVAEIAEGWYAVTAAVGLDKPYATLHAWYGGLKEAQFGNEAAEANATEPQ